jgi:hypothetical protein
MKPPRTRARHGEPQEWLSRHLGNGADEGCLTWPFAKNQYGYALVRWDGKLQLVSRIVCEHVHGPAPTPEHEAAHSCEKGHLGCIDGAHLRWATHVDNHGDRIRSGTILRGEDIAHAKLTTESAIAIRRRYASGLFTQQTLADEYGVSRRAVGKLVTGETWKHIEQAAQ